MPRNLSENPIFIVIQTSKDIIDPIIRHLNECSLSFQYKKLLHKEEIILTLDSKEADNSWQQILSIYHPHYLELEYMPPHIDRRFFRTYKQQRFPSQISTEECTSVHNFIKKRFESAIKDFNIASSFYNSTLYFSMLFYITLDFIQKQQRHYSKQKPSIENTYFDLLKKWSPKELDGYKHLNLDTLEALQII
jgi:hypothetical protein